MRSIEKISVIKKENLSSEFYFQSLLKEAYDHQLVTEDEIKRIESQCISLLAYKTECFNGGDSSSIRVEVARDIMTSNLYTIGIWLKTFESADDALVALKKTTIDEAYKNGRKRITIMLRTAKSLHAILLKNLISTDNYFYSATMAEGIQGFFKLYRPDYAAHEIHITADYLPHNQVKDLVGIEFIRKLLEAIYYENLFCLNFSEKDIQDLLSGYDEKYEDLLINIYEIVLTSAIGCIIANADVRRLNITGSDILYLCSFFQGKSHHEIITVIQGAFMQIKYVFPIKNASQLLYIEKSLHKIAKSILSASTLKTIDKLFIIPKHPDLNPKLSYNFGESMDYESYRKITAKIMGCRNSSDKIAIIKSAASSLGDLENMLLDACLSENEITEVLARLNLPELIVLAKKYRIFDAMGDLGLVEQEQALCRSLHCVVKSRTNEEQLLISRAAQVLTIDYL